ncbi:MAG: c-type cytochrome domain-containing protein [Pirellulaceae bacterium]
MRLNPFNGESSIVRLVCLLLWFDVSFGGHILAVDTVSDFESDIAPLLIRRCVECHQGSNPSGGLLLTTRAGLHAGGDSGEAIDSRK